MDVIPSSFMLSYGICMLVSLVMIDCNTYGHSGSSGDIAPVKPPRDKWHRFTYGYTPDPDSTAQPDGKSGRWGLRYYGVRAAYLVALVLTVYLSVAQVTPRNTLIPAVTSTCTGKQVRVAIVQMCIIK